MLKRSTLLLMMGISLFMVQACTSAVPTPTPTPTNTPTLTPTPTCETHTASVALTASAERIQVGETVGVTVTLDNQGCVALGMPQYQLNIKPGTLFAQTGSEPVVHYLSVAPGQSDTAAFELEAVASGRARVMASTSFEVHLGDTGPAYWGNSAGGPLFIEVAP
jgi:hypothetical protein